MWTKFETQFIGKLFANTEDEKLEEEDEDFEPKVKPKKRGRPKSTSESKKKLTTLARTPLKISRTKQATVPRN